MDIKKPRDFETLSEYTDYMMEVRNKGSFGVIVDLWEEVQNLKQDIADLHEIIAWREIEPFEEEVE